MIAASAATAASDLQTLLSSGLAAAQDFDAWLLSSSTGYIIRLYGYFYAISILASCWVFYVARGLAPGPWRALACLPVSAAQLAVTPFLVDRHRTPVLIVPVMGIFSISAFKVGPLTNFLELVACPGCQTPGDDVAIRRPQVMMGVPATAAVSMSASPHHAGTCRLQHLRLDAVLWP